MKERVELSVTGGWKMPCLDHVSRISLSSILSSSDIELGGTTSSITHRAPEPSTALSVTT